MNQTDAINRQKALTQDAQRIAEALQGESTPALIQHLLSEARMSAATRLRNHRSYLIRLQSRPVDEEELFKSLNVQARFSSEQAELKLALGLGEPIDTPASGSSEAA
jgi:hypothetical protein